jgi:hypothetical protein
LPAHTAGDLRLRLTMPTAQSLPAADVAMQVR